MTRKEEEMSGDDSVTEVAAKVRADLGLDGDQGEGSAAKKKAKKRRKVRKEAPPPETESSSEAEEKMKRKKKEKKVIWVLHCIIHYTT